jgi:hypothetical protein
MRIPLLASLIVLGCALVGGCAARPAADGLDPADVPKGARAEYEVFAQRCSKCHSLARPLNSGITDDAYWSLYVERMRRQPGSGISPRDATEILRFLSQYSAEQRRRKEAR